MDGYDFRFTTHIVAPCRPTVSHPAAISRAVSKGASSQDLGMPPKDGMEKTTQAWKGRREPTADYCGKMW